MHHPLSRCAAIALLILPVTSPRGSSAELADLLRPLLRGHQGEATVAVKHLGSGESFYHREDEPMPTASLIKFPVMVEAYRQDANGQVSLSDELSLSKENLVPGSGILTQHFSPGAKITLRDAIRLMIVYSDNSATNLVLDRIGLGSTTAQMERLGMPHSKIHSKVFRRETSLHPERSQEFGLGSTTARETIQLYEMLFKRELVSDQASQAMLDHLLHCDDSSKIVRDLPAETKVAHKSGATSQVRTDGGLILSPGGPIAICVLTRRNQDRRFADDNQAHRLCGAVARSVYDHFNPLADERTPAEPASLRVGDTGRLVEDLQRTLNARLVPSPNLSVDGDFGSVTKAAVLRFQQNRDLKVSGEVDAEMWAALGTLESPTDDERSPNEVNSEELPLAEVDALHGRPFVTCKAWAVGDGATGQLLWSSNADKKLDIASTTKIMTAYVVLKLARDLPSVLEEVITFSERADRTVGSTAAVRTGERLSVHKALYGLLLPSGNDASVALAEHFGSRFRPTTESADSTIDPVEQFIGQMNREADDLGMSKTRYRNTHGLTAKGHQSTAQDLIKLAQAAWQLGAFRQYVGTRQHGCELVGPGGYRRNIVWKNTNRLLGTAGYDGIKTGTTTAAGACLVSTAERDGKRRFLVVLGSASSAARYADTRNLYRWVWNQSL